MGMPAGKAHRAVWGAYKTFGTRPAPGYRLAFELEGAAGRCGVSVATFIQALAVAMDGVEAERG